MITIREATHADLGEILGIYNEIIEHTTAVYDYHAHTLAMRLSWFDSKKKDGYPVLVADEQDKVIGFSSFGPFRAWAAYQYTVEHSVYVDKEQRGRGIGALLMAPLIEAAKNKGMHSMVAGIDASNAESIRLHKKFGFEEVAHFKEVGYKFNRWLDLVFLQLMLNR